MLFHPNRAERLAAIADRLRTADELTANLVTEVAAELCGRPPAYPQYVPPSITFMINARAWIDAACAIAAHALPQWKLRHLIYDEGRWHCSLSSMRDMPQWLDQPIETSHEILPLALLAAIVDAARREHPIEDKPNVPQARIQSGNLMSCDNFA